MTSAYDPRLIESQWSESWERDGCYRAPDHPDGPKFFNYDSGPFPNGSMHMGHVRTYLLGDVMARYQRAQGRSVLYCTEWDAFGLPNELQALSEGDYHPASSPTAVSGRCPGRCAPSASATIGPESGRHAIPNITPGRNGCSSSSRSWASCRGAWRVFSTVRSARRCSHACRSRTKGAGAAARRSRRVGFPSGSYRSPGTDRGCSLDSIDWSDGVHRLGTWCAASLTRTEDASQEIG